jgi:hypothetical protein
MKMLLRAAELLVALLLVAWTVIFPLATLLSLVVTLPMIALAAWAPALTPRR